MNSSKSHPRRRPRLSPALDALESRELLTAGAGNTVAILAGSVSQAGATAPITFNIDPSNFTIPRGRMLLGVDAAAASSSTIDPSLSPVGMHRGATMQSRTITGTEAALIAHISQPRRGPSGPLTFNATVTGKNQTTGNFLVGFYLPGDANGDGTVDKTDIRSIRSELGAVAGDSKYTFDADSNRDGRITFLDMMLAKQNMGVKSTLTPIVSSNLDPNSDTGASDRVTTLTSAHFTGDASGGATITYSEIHQRVPDVTTVAAPDGTYSISTQLAQGSNQFRVTVTDSSGQRISGVISPVYSAPVLATFTSTNGSQSG